MMSIGRVSAGNGYEYLTGAVRNDAHDYYVGAGEAPGRWTGSGCERLGLHGAVVDGEMANLFGAAAHPTTGEILSAPYRHYRTIEERITAKTETLGPDPTADQVAAVRAEQYRIGDRAPVAGYDCTFSPVKSVSAVWALAPAAERREIEDAHDAAIDAAFGWLEQRALHTRAGRDGVRHLDAEGFIVARFRHRTSRNGDPQLHTHCAVANRVWSPTEERWRALDGQGLYRERAGADAVYTAALERELTGRLGFEFETRGDTREVATVPAELIVRWSSRRRQILDRYDELTGELSRARTAAERSNILRTVTLETRRDKIRDGHVGLHERWNAEAADLGVTWQTLATVPSAASATVELDRDLVVHAALDALEGSRARWTYSHLAAAIAKAADRALSGDELRVLVDQTLGSGRVVELSVADVGDDAPMTRADGESVYRDPQREQWSTIAITDAEAFLIETATQPTAPVTARSTVKAALATRNLGVDQAVAVEQILCDPERISVVIGPAGTGKTHAQWTVVDIARLHGREVLGLALSQNAADVLADEAGCRCENIAKTRWHNYPFPNGGVVIVDEAAMAGTPDLAWIARTAVAADCKVVFVGDDLQLQSPSAGGIIRTLTHSPSTVWLGEVRRFTSRWEADATIQLRDGDAGVAATYQRHDRLRGGTRDEMTAAIVADWWDDHLRGVSTLMMAGDNDTVADLAGAARALRIAAGEVEANGVTIRDGNRVGRGDRIVTRRNNPYLVSEHGRPVTNRAVWTVTDRHPDGALTVVGERHGGRLFLPPDYVNEHVELAYAATGHGAQGRTVDGGRTLYDERSTRSSLYVMMTRGRHFNIGYGTLDQPSDTDLKQIAENAAVLFAKVVGNDDRAISATEQLANELEYADSTSHLDALRDDWTSLISNHLRAEGELQPGDRVNAADRDNIGTIINSDDDTCRAVVQFTSPEGHQANVDLPTDSLTLLRPVPPEWLSDLDGARNAAEQTGDHELVQMIDYLTDIETDRHDKAAELVASAHDQPWSELVPTERLSAVAYYRDRYEISNDDPIGPEPSTRSQAKHEEWHTLRPSIKPTATLRDLVHRGDVSSNAAGNVDAVKLRRETVLAEIDSASTPPQWAAAVVGPRWSTDPQRHGQQQALVGKLALYRDRYGTTGPGIGQRPIDSTQSRIWTVLRHEIASQTPPKDLVAARNHVQERER
ncbi:MAG: MobF family relaxase [Ilumatobacteraceae bacterium]